MNKTKEPLITIGITCYNAADTIGRAIESALAQDWQNKEILIVDDCSTDGSVEMIEAMAAHTGNIRLIKHESNQGVGGARKTLVGNAKGEFIAFFDDDDVSTPIRLQQQYERITAYEQIYGADMVICHTARTQKYPDGFEHYEPTMGTDETAPAPQGEDVADRILIGRLNPGTTGSCAGCALMARTATLKKAGSYDPALRRAEDTDLNIRFALSDGHFVGIAAPLVTQTMTRGSEKTITREYQSERTLLEKYKTYLKQKGWYDFCRAWLEIRYDHLNGNAPRAFGHILMLALKHPVKVIFKLYWAIPARATRKAFKQWHQSNPTGQ